MLLFIAGSISEESDRYIGCQCKYKPIYKENKHFLHDLFKRMYYNKIRHKYYEDLWQTVCDINKISLLEIKLLC
jgi:thymidylate synthase ThyX